MWIFRCKTARWINQIYAIVKIIIIIIINEKYSVIVVVYSAHNREGPDLRFQASSTARRMAKPLKCRPTIGEGSYTKVLEEQQPIFQFLFPCDYCASLKNYFVSFLN